MDSRRVVSSLLEVDPGFERLCKTLFGDMVEPEDVWAFMYAPDGISKMDPVVKANPDQADVSVKRGRLMRTVRKSQVQKADLDVVWSGQIVKADEDKHQVFGWASVVEVDGKPVVDRQGDWITPDEIEKAAYHYVLENRRGGNQHKRDADDQPMHASSLIESFVVTPEKIEKMGLPKDTPVGWWVGYKVHDEDAWSDIKKGLKTGFSIHGKGKRREIEDMSKRDYLVAKGLPSALKGQLKTGLKPRYAQAPATSSRILASRNGQIAGKLKATGNQKSADQWKWAGQMDRSRSRFPEGTMAQRFPSR